MNVEEFKAVITKQFRIKSSALRMLMLAFQPDQFDSTKDDSYRSKATFVASEFGLMLDVERVGYWPDAPAYQILFKELPADFIPLESEIMVDLSGNEICNRDIAVETVRFDAQFIDLNVEIYTLGIKDYVVECLEKKTKIIATYDLILRRLVKDEVITPISEICKITTDERCHRTYVQYRHTHQQADDLTDAMKRNHLVSTQMEAVERVFRQATIDPKCDSTSMTRLIQKMYHAVPSALKG